MKFFADKNVRWHRDAEAKVFWDHIDREVAPLIERMALGFKYTHCGVSRTSRADVFNGQPEELVIRVHLRRTPEANAIRAAFEGRPSREHVTEEKKVLGTDPSPNLSEPA